MMDGISKPGGVAEMPHAGGPPLFVITMQLTLAAMLFTRLLERRDHFIVRLFVAIVAFNSLDLIWVRPLVILSSSLSSPIDSLVTVLAFSGLLGFLVLGILFIFRCSRWTALFCGAAAYAVQNVMHTLPNVVNPLAMEALGVDLAPFWSFEMLIFSATVLLVCWFAVSHSVGFTSEIEVKNHSVLVIVCLVIVVSIIANMLTDRIAGYGAPRSFVAVEYLINLTTGMFILFAAYELLYNNQLRLDMATMERIRADEARQLQVSKDTIDAINVKCHDIRHQIRALGSENGIAGESFLHDMAHEVDIYDSTIKTGNATLDVILTEKSFLCESKGIRLTCIVDGSTLGFISPVDLYSFFGNALDNAIEAVEDNPCDEKRLINLSVRSLAGSAVIHLENYFQGTIDFVNGVPQTHKADTSAHGFGMRSMTATVESYHGTLATTTQGDVFQLNAIVPIPKGA